MHKPPHNVEKGNFMGREYVILDDVKRLASSAFEHRIRVKTEAEMERNLENYN